MPHSPGVSGQVLAELFSAQPRGQALGDRDPEPPQILAAKVRPSCCHELGDRIDLGVLSCLPETERSLLRSVLLLPLPGSTLPEG